MAGLDPVDEGMPVTGVEAGWRLARSAWGHGYATEAALACLDVGFGPLGAAGDLRHDRGHQRALAGRDAPDRHDP